MAIGTRKIRTNRSPPGVVSFFFLVGVLSRGGGWKKAAKGRRGWGGVVTASKICLYLENGAPGRGGVGLCSGQNSSVVMDSLC